MIMLIRYDTESLFAEKMEGFFEKVVQVHRADAIPATFFCRGWSIDNRELQFRAFFDEVADDPLFDIQDHSYTHIGLGYEAGKPVETLRDDYELSFAAHERVFGRRPIGVSICGTSGADGQRLGGFDETDKATAEFEMICSLGVRMINSFLTGIDESKQFTSYARLGRPDVMGFPSGFSDTGWMYDWRKQEHKPGAVDYLLGVIEGRADAREHMPIMLHDWLAWMHAPDRELTHVRRFAERGRQLGYRLATHLDCLNDEALWRPTAGG